MQRDTVTIVKMSSKKIYTLLDSIIEEAKKKLYCSDLLEEEWENLILSEIEESKKLNLEDRAYIEYMNERIPTMLFTYIKNSFQKSEVVIKLVKNLMKEENMSDINVQDALAFFGKLEDVFSYYDYVPSKEAIKELINQENSLSQMLECVMKTNEEEMYPELKSQMLKNNTLQCFIDVYGESKKPILNDPILDIKEECEYIEGLSKYPLLSEEEERKLVQRISLGDKEARDLLIKSNLRLVVSRAKKKVGLGLSFGDLFQEGTIGLMKSIDYYDVDRGYRFATLAYISIDQHIERAIKEKSRNIQLTAYSCKKLFLYKNAVSRLQFDLNREPSEEEIREELTKEFAQKFKREMKITTNEVAKLKQIEQDTLSLNCLIGDEEQSELISFVPSSDPTPEETVMEQIREETIKQGVRKLLENSNLTTREKQIITLRYGLSGMEPMTWEEMGSYLGVRRQGLQARESRILSKLRDAAELQKISNQGMDLRKLVRS